MQVYFGDPTRYQLPYCALTIGNFDGVHVGHQAMLAKLKMEATRRQFPAALLTFEPHPREFFPQDRPLARLSTLRDKLAFLRETATVDYVFVYRFTRGFSQMQAACFIDDVLVHQLKARYVLIGKDFQFGANREGNFSLLEHYPGFVAEAMPTLSMADKRVSSSAVRERLWAGDLATARSLLGRYYQISGRVMHGQKLGRVLGFPTANICLPLCQPALEGVFVVEVDALGGQFCGVASLGKNPTVTKSTHYKLEVYLFDFAANLYGKRITVRFLKKLRDEERYDSLAQLVAQMHEDVRSAKHYLIQLQREKA